MAADIGFGLKFDAKDSFFDWAALQKMADTNNKKGLSRAGAFIRRRAMSLLRRRKGPSTAPAPPSVHSRDKVANLRNILFAYVPGGHGSVVVGPVKLNQKNDATLNGHSGFDLGNVTVPQLHEFGGVLRITEWRFANSEHWNRGRKAPRGAKVIWRVRRATYPKRPTMAEALRLEKDNIPQGFAGETTSAAA